jgi:hypothetical protein
MPSIPDAAPRPSPARGIEPPALAALAIVVLLAATRLAEPFAWDQAMFMLGARVLHHGGVLYRDYWDPKQPGLFAFYWLAGALFGFDETGLHTLELIVMALFALLLLLGLRARLRPPWALAAAPLLTVGWYFAVCTDWHLSQIEGLAGLPLWLALWCATRGAERERGGTAWWLAAGIAGGAALALKLLLAPVVIAVGLVPLAALARRSGGGARAGTAVVAAAIGIVIPLALMVGYFAAHGALPLALWTNLSFPTELMQRSHGFRFGPFIGGLGWFARTWAPMLPFAAFGAWSALRPRFEPLWAGLVAWFGAGVLVILIQKLSYWEYQYLLLSVPVGLLAARGLAVLAPALGDLVPSWPRRERVAMLAVAAALLFVPPLVPTAARLVTLVHHRLGLTAQERRAYQDRVSHGGGYPKIAEDLARSPLGAPHANTGPVWVLGNPLYYWLSGRDQAVARNGASFIEFMTREQWVALTADLARAHPAYILVHRDYEAMLGPQHPETAPFVTWLGADYGVVGHDERCTWYAPRVVVAGR